MRMERHEIDIDNFIKGKIEGLHPRKFVVEPLPDFAGRTMDKIYRLEGRRRFLTLYGLAALWALGPLALRQLWLLIRNDYFAAARLPFGSIIVEVYHFSLSWVGAFLFLAVGIFVSLLFIFKLRRSGYNSPISPALHSYGRSIR